MDCIIPAAGMGTRFLPFSKVVPKELLPLFGTPAIDFILQELDVNGIHRVNLIISEEKKLLFEYFQTNTHLNNFLKTHHKAALLDIVTQFHNQFSLRFPVQKEALGLGHAILQAESTAEVVSVVLPDELLFSGIGQPSLLLSRMLEIQKKYDAHVIAVQKVHPAHANRYGMIGYTPLSDTIFKVTDLVEKPSIDQAPSDYAIIGRYVLKDSIFNALKQIKPGIGGEIQLTDGLKHLLEQKEKIIGLVFEEKRFDIGIPEGWFDCLSYIQSSKTIT
ncbi:UTP--glucose-1-phosphate uridylyltransferase [bacterium]|nr:MAG: UTP--glucose-1-phosphate uridylyltransferase [bacterium]QQR61866.1 MAG: UTP--glucose-1-phosphate uridylyltransferase [bacterium]QQR62553.1 MAG: UTP--glucose-1-phosphate uridylyltransferase [bacterium]